MNDLQIRYISNKKLAPTEKSYVIDRKYWQEIPDFTYQALPVYRVLQAEWVSMAAFAVWLLLLLFLIRRTAHRLTAL